ncbi:MAG: PAS domain-containing protein, partial [Hyphomicrobiales bacterium]|nr:PAS domain-containing protein [Hyphomicrobiales bacterium]
MVKSIRGLATYFQSLVHDSACNDPVTLARHQSFIGSHLLGGFLALAAFPVYLAAVGRPSLISALAFVWLLSPIAIAKFLSRTGRLGTAHLVSAINLTGLVIFAAGLTGGVTSFLVVWMIVVPLKAALSGDRRIVLGGIAIACAGIVALGAGSILSVLPEARSLSTDPVLMAFLSSVSALVYAGGLALSIQIIHRRSEEAIRQGEARYQLLADNATDMITRHDPDGDVVFASAASFQLLGNSPQSLLGDGLFQRIHVADRPGYRTALSRCVVEDRP